MNLCKNFTMLLVLFQPLLSVDQICPTPVPKQYALMQPGNVVMAYLGNWDISGPNQYNIPDIAAIADKITHIAYSFALPDEQTARCVLSDLLIDIGARNEYQEELGGAFAQLLALKQQFPHLKILLSIGGGKSNKAFLKLAENPAWLQKFARSCIEILTSYSYSYEDNAGVMQTNHVTYDGLFDGIDMDWELNPSSMTSKVKKSYLLFMQELRKLLDEKDRNDGRKSLLTIALQVTPKVYKNLPLVKLTEYVDWFNVMAYDFSGPWSRKSGFNAPVCSGLPQYSVDGALHSLMQAGLSPEMMVLGLPLYGYVYTDTAGYHANVSSKDKVKAVSYHKILSQYGKNRLFKKFWNHDAAVPFLYDKQDQVFISYDDADAIEAKVRLAQFKKLKGVFLWRLSGDDAQHSIINSIAACS